MAKKMVVKALVKFSDARTGRDYRPGDVIEGWGAARAQHYAKAGLVAVSTVQPSAEQLSLGSNQPAAGSARSKGDEDEKAEPEEVKEEAEDKEAKPGPSEKKPTRKPKTKK